MSDANTRGEQSSEGFLYWLKNAPRRFWNYIVSCFRPKKPKTEHQPTSEEQKNDDNNNDESKSSKVEQKKTAEPDPQDTQVSDSLSNQNKEEVAKQRQIQNKDSGALETPVNLKSSTMSRSSSEASLRDAPVSESPASSVRDSAYGGGGDSPQKDETSLQPRQTSSDNDTKKDKPKAQSCEIRKTESQLEQGKRREEVLKKKEELDKKNEENGNATLEKGKKKQKEAEERRQQETEKKKPSVKNEQKRNSSGDRSALNSSSPKSSLSRSNSSLSSLNSKKC